MSICGDALFEKTQGRWHGMGTAVRGRISSRRMTGRKAAKDSKQLRFMGAKQEEISAYGDTVHRKLLILR
jgi:hypothetical protein